MVKSVYGSLQMLPKGSENKVANDQFPDGFICRSVNPWNSKMSDDELLDLYEKAIEAKANKDFINLILEEMKKRVVKKLKGLSCLGN